MTVASETNKSGPYNGNGVTTAFDYEFRIVSDDHVKAILTDANGDETVLTKTTDYSVTGVGAAGGQVIMVVAPATGKKLTLVRNVPFVQETDLENQGAYNAEDVEDALDLAAMRDQQLAEELSRAVQIPVSADPAELPALIGNIIRLSESADQIDTVAGIQAQVVVVASVSADIEALAPVALDIPTLAAVADEIAALGPVAASLPIVAENVEDVKNFADVYQGAKAADPTLRNDGSALQAGDLYFNTSTNFMQVYDGSEWGDTAGTPLNVSTKSFTGDGATTAFALNTSPGSVNNLFVTVGGVLQKPVTDYTIAGSTLTFTAAPPNLAEINTWVLATTVTLNVPADGSVTATAISDDPEDQTGIREKIDAAHSQDHRRNRIVNGDMSFSQENGNTSGTTNGFYAADQWAAFRVTSAGTITAQRVQSRTPAGATDRFRVTITTADTSLAAGEYLTITQNLEGSNVKDFLYGTASAKAAVLRFGFKGPAGTYAVALHNSALNRSFVALFTVAAGQANTDTVQEIAITGDTSGTWLTADGVIGITLDIVLACGSTFQGATGWQAANVLGTSGVSNGMGTGSAVFELFDVGLKVDPDAAGVYGQFELGADAVYRPERYWEKSFATSQIPAQNVGVNTGEYQWGVASAASINAWSSQVPFSAFKAKSPVISLYSPGSASFQIRNFSRSLDFSSTTTQNISQRGFIATGVTPATTVAGDICGVHWTANARLS